MSESVARACKAAKLLWALENHGRRIKLDPSTVAGINQLTELAGCFGDREWELLAHIARVNPPSNETRRLVILLLRTKASFIFDQPPEKSLPYSERPGKVEVCP